MKKILLAVALLAFVAVPARAAVDNVTASGFLITIKAQIKAPPPRVFAALGQVGRWWAPEHTYSGNAASLGLEMRAGGCFCERWNQNSIEHARVIYVATDKTLRLEGSLGPLQEMAVSGVLSFGLQPAPQGTALTFTYRVRGSPDAALDKVAAVVDRVLGEQVARLARFVESGTAVAEAPAAPPEDRFFSSEGVRLRFVDEGKGSDVVLLLHDTGSSVDDQWVATGIFPTLVKQGIFRVIALDLRGHGKSAAGPAAGVEMGEDAVRLLSHLDVPRAHVIGYGLGAQIAAWLAANHPQRMVTLTLAGGAQARQGPFALTDDQMRRIPTPTLGLVGLADPAVRDVAELRLVMPRLWRYTPLADETHATTPRSEEFIVAIQYFLRYHPARVVKP